MSDPNISGFIAADIKGSGGWTQVILMTLMVMLLMTLMVILMLMMMVILMLMITVDFKISILEMCFMPVIQIYCRPTPRFYAETFVQNLLSVLISKFKIKSSANQSFKS